MRLCREEASGRLVVVKRRSAADREAIRREARALASLDACPFAPRLLFAFDAPDGAYLGMPCRPGRALAAMRDALGPGEARAIGAALGGVVATLHDRFGFTHGDLSPSNVIVAPGERAGAWDVSLVDWEYGEAIADANVESYAGYRGTPGFAPSDRGASLVERDRRALVAVLAHLGGDPLDEDGRFPKRSDRGWTRWFRRI